MRHATNKQNDEKARRTCGGARRSHKFLLFPPERGRMGGGQWGVDPGSAAAPRPANKGLRTPVRP